MKTATTLAPSSRPSRERRNRTFKSAIAWLLAVAYLFPVYWMINTSLKNNVDMFASPPQWIPSNLYLGSYQAVFSDKYGITAAFVNSLIIAGCALVLTLIIAIPASYAVARLRGTVTTSMLIMLTVVQLVPAIAISVPLFVMFRQVNLINTYASVILANVSGNLPFAVILLRPYFQMFPYEVEEAARLDGLSRIGTIVRIVIPTIRPGVIMIGSFAFLMSWGEFTYALTLLTQKDVQPLTVALNRIIGQYGTSWNDLMAVAAVISAPVLILFVVLQRYIVAGLAGGATDG